MNYYNFSWFLLNKIQHYINCFGALDPGTTGCKLDRTLRIHHYCYIANRLAVHSSLESIFLKKTTVFYTN